MLRRHTPYWKPNPYQPLDEPRWEDQIAAQVTTRVKALLVRHAAGELEWSDFIKDRKSTDGGWGMKMCLWHQHHKNDQRHKNLGRPFWSVAAFREWAANIASLPASEVTDRSGRHSERTLKTDQGGALRTFLRHEHVVPKDVMIKWMVREPENVDTILSKNVCCVITLDEDGRLERATHPEPLKPWKRYERKAISVLFNPDWPDDIVSELKSHGLLTEESYRPFGDKTREYRVSGAGTSEGTPWL